eukprot:7189483-Alexandrium_andersonii.AAC.1
MLLRLSPQGLSAWQLQAWQPKQPWSSLPGAGRHPRANRHAGPLATSWPPPHMTQQARQAKDCPERP